MVEVKMDDGRKEKQLLYYDGETISGKASYHYTLESTPFLHPPTNSPFPL